MNTHQYLGTFAALFVATSLVGCGGDGASGKTTDKPADYSDLVQTPLSADSLALADAETMETHLKNGLRLNLHQTFTRAVEFGGDVAVPQSANPESAGKSGADGNFSTTNVHVDGVDEADYAKYDGQHWYLATSTEYALNQVKAGPGIRIFETDPSTADAWHVADYALDKEWGAVSELYLVGDEQNGTTDVAALRNQWGNIYPFFDVIGPPGGIAVAEPAIASRAMWFAPQNGSIQIQLVDVKDPANPSESWSAKIDGTLVQSRKIGNKLYLITRFDPWIQTLQMGATDAQQKDKNEQAIQDTAVNKLMPTASINGGEPAPLVDRCYLQKNITDKHGFGSVLNITTIDLKAQKIVDSTCANVALNGIYMSQKTLYIGGSDYSVFGDGFQGRTVLHKFDLVEDGVAYKASGSVPGYLNWRDPSFSLDEFEGKLRVMTTSRDEKWQPVHQLTILEEAPKTLSLDVISTLPNKDRPKVIGKPGEDIQSVRFAGDRAYVVTFQRTDPLYVLDLKDPLDPVVAGELEVPGFSTYLHPINDNYVFSFGQDANTDGRVKGVKVSLFDVGDISKPSEVNSIYVGDQGSHSEAINNLKALSFLKTSEDQIRVTIPITVREALENSNGTAWKHTALYLFEINGFNTDKATLDAAGYIVSETPTDTKRYPTGSGVDRGMLHDEAVYYTHANSVWAAFWSDPKNAKGPISSPNVCTLEVRNGLEVTLKANSTVNTTLCSASVVATEKTTDYRENLQPLRTNDVGKCTFVGAAERAGTFDIRAEAKGYNVESVTDVVVTADECHVNTQKVEIELSPSSVICTTVVVPALRVTVHTGVEGLSNCDATVVATDGLFSETLEPTFNGAGGDVVPDCVYTGVAERAGTYDITVSAKGYDSVMLNNIVVEGDICHVKTREVKVELPIAMPAK